MFKIFPRQNYLFGKAAKQTIIHIKDRPERYFSTSFQSQFKTCVIGASGGIGQPLCLLLKLNPLVTRLDLYDPVKFTKGVAKDLSHINTCTEVKGYKKQKKLAKALSCADLVLIPAGVPRKPGMSRADLFNVNASIVYEMAQAISRYAPTAVCAIITNPINSVVPIAAEAMKKSGCYDPCKLLGVTTLDVIRAATFVGKINGIDPSAVSVPVIGGHAGATIIPVLSQSNPPVNLCEQGEIIKLTKRIQNAGTEVVKAKAGSGSATLSMAFAAARLATAILRGLNGESGVVECAYVESNLTRSPFFANPVVFGQCGIVQNLGYGCLNEYEAQLLNNAVKVLKKDCAKGVKFAKNYKKKGKEKGKGKRKC